MANIFVKEARLERDVLQDISLRLVNAIGYDSIKAVLAKFNMGIGRKLKEKSEAGRDMYELIYQDRPLSKLALTGDRNRMKIIKRVVG